MTIKLKEYDGARAVEIEHVDGALFIETDRECYKFDLNILLRALEQECGIVACRIQRALSG